VRRLRISLEIHALIDHALRSSSVRTTTRSLIFYRLCEEEIVLPPVAARRGDYRSALSSQPEGVAAARWLASF
jgi:hypothetical protein